jgi:hypothetical protein
MLLQLAELNTELIPDLAIVDENPRDLARYGLDRPTRTIRLLGQGRREMGTIAFGLEEKDKVYLRSSAFTRVWAVSKSRLTFVPAARGDL